MSIITTNPTNLIKNTIKKIRKIASQKFYAYNIWNEYHNLQNIINHIIIYARNATRECCEEQLEYYEEIIKTKELIITEIVVGQSAYIYIDLLAYENEKGSYNPHSLMIY